MCHQGCTHNGNNTMGCQRVKRSGTPPGGCSTNQHPEITRNPHDMAGIQGHSSRIQHSSVRITQRTSVELRRLRHNRSGTPPGGCSSRQTNSTSPFKGDDATQRIDVENLFQSCTEITKVEKDDTSFKIQNLGIVELFDNGKIKTDGNSARSSVGINDCKNSKKDGLVLKCDNFSITQIIEKLNNATDTTSSVCNPSENKDDIPQDKERELKCQNRTILELIEKAQNRNDKKRDPNTLNGLKYQDRSIFEIIETSQNKHVNTSRLSPESGDQNHNVSVPNIVTPKVTGRVLKHQKLSICQIIENAQNRRDTSSSSHLIHQNTSVVKLFEKLDSSTTSPSRHDDTSCHKVSHSNRRSLEYRKSSLKHQNLSINEILQNAQRNRDVHSTRLHPESLVLENDENSNHLTMAEIVWRLKCSGDKLQSSMCQGVSFPDDKKRAQNNYESNSRLFQPESPKMDTNYVHRSRQSLNSNKTPSKFSLESRGQTRDDTSESSYPIPLPYKTGTDYEKPCMFQVQFPEPSQLPLPPPSFLQSRTKPSAIPRHMRRATMSRFQ